MNRKLQTILFLSVLTATAAAGPSLVFNGSFEADGEITNIAVTRPYRWCEVDIPDNFSGRIVDFGTHGYEDGLHSLVLSTARGDTVAGVIAEVSQMVYLADADELIFDIELSTSRSWEPWDNAKRTAMVLIDGEMVWSSSELNTEIAGPNTVTFDLSQYSGDETARKLTLAVRCEVAESPRISYFAYWDFVKFSAYCGGLGYLQGDLNQDCYVDITDFAILAARWLGNSEGLFIDPTYDEIVDNADLMIFAADWLYNTDWQNWGDENCVEMELLTADLDDSGIVDFSDIAILQANWLQGATNCDLSDIDRDGMTGITDFALMANQWNKRSWLYDVQ